MGCVSLHELTATAHSRKATPGIFFFFPDSLEQEVYSWMCGGHGKGPRTGRQRGDGWGLRTDTPSQILWSPQEPGVCVCVCVYVCVCVVCVLEVGVVDGADPTQKRENVVPDSHSGSKPRILKLEENREESK